jgi:p-aminobenzoyl-glutamate transporter AbgT
MKISDTESKILLRMYDICFISLDDEMSLRHLYSVTSKQYLWITIKNMESKKLINSYTEGKIKFIKFSPLGKIIVKALVTIRDC